MSLNKVLLIGNVGKDPEVRNLESGAKTASFTLATSERYKDRSGETREMTEWHNIVAWRGLADLAENYIRKGSQIYVEGRIRSRSYTDRDGNTRYITEIQADAIQLLGRKSDNPASQNGGNYGHQGGYGGNQGGYGQQQGGYAPAQQPAPRPAAPAPAPAPFVEEGDAGDDLPF